MRHAVTSLDPIFIPPQPKESIDLELLESTLLQAEINVTKIQHILERIPFNAIYDFLRSTSHTMMQTGRSTQVVTMIQSFDTALTHIGTQEGSTMAIHAALMQTLTSLHLLNHDHTLALDTAAQALTLLSQYPKRKDEPWLTVLALLLYDVAQLHHSRDQHKQAEREIDKSLKLLERLARINPQRYGPAHLMAINASTSIIQSRQKQANTLSQYKAATETYLRQYSDGTAGAAMQLIESLTAEGRTLVKMNRHREAVQYFTRAIKLLSRLEQEFSMQQLDLSIDLGQALLQLKGTRDKGIHLLNTMLYKANRMNAQSSHLRIVDILVDAKNPSLEIFNFWHKLFPRS